MKQLLVMWIIFQVVTLSVTKLDIENEVINKTYVCPKGDTPLFMAAIFPLAAFLPSENFIENYCNY